MSSLNSTISLNATIVLPPLLFINGFYSMHQAKYFYAFLGFVFVVSVLGNSFVMFVIYTERSFHTPKYLAVFHLVFTELGISISLIPNLIAMFLFDSQYITLDPCLANLFFVYLFACVEGLNLIILAYDRLVAICFPLRYHAIITISVVAVMLAVSWAISTILMILTFSLFRSFSFCRSNMAKQRYFCDHGTWLILECKENLVNNLMSIVNMVFFLFLPMIMNLLSYVFIAVALVKISSWEGRLKAIKTCSAHLMLVAIRYLTAMGTYLSAATNTFNPNARAITTSLSFAIPPMMNPIIYVLNTEEIKDVSKKLLKRKKNTTETTKNSDKGIN